jgi:hypothetical protein
MTASRRRLLGLALLLALLSWGAQALGQAPRPPGLTRGEREFLDRHWRRPIPPQGPAPERFTPIERSLRPADCGTCHPAQWSDWATSLHARAMGPGVAGQFVEMAASDPEGARSCLSCHAPLAEQWPGSPAFDAGLQREGVVCAACHVRRHERFGPPRRRGGGAETRPRSTLPHNGVTRTSAYLRSEFCSSCHQFGPEGFALNGKLLENTYEEWRKSPAASQGLQCQDCHMPDRRHLWRGIHDPEMVRSGVDITLTTDRSRYAPGQDVRASLTIRSTRVGHHFPTYVTPRVVVRVELVDMTGQPLPGTAVERAIGREVPLDLSREIADTRIPAGGRFTLQYRRPLSRPGLRLRAAVTVHPDHFYTGFFQALLEGGAGAGTPQIREALEATRRSSFVLWSREIPLT